MKKDDYPDWICSDCASKVVHRKPCCACYHYDICDVCNNWTEVTQPRDYGYPKVKSQMNKGKILAQLEDVKRLYIEKNEVVLAERIEERIVNLRMG